MGTGNGAGSGPGAVGGTPGGTGGGASNNSGGGGAATGASANASGNGPSAPSNTGASKDAAAAREAASKTNAAGNMGSGASTSAGAAAAAARDAATHAAAAQGLGLGSQNTGPSKSTSAPNAAAAAAANAAGLARAAAAQAPGKSTMAGLGVGYDSGLHAAGPNAAAAAADRASGLGPGLGVGSMSGPDATGPNPAAQAASNQAMAKGLAESMTEHNSSPIAGGPLGMSVGKLGAFGRATGADPFGGGLSYNEGQNIPDSNFGYTRDNNEFHPDTIGPRTGYGTTPLGEGQAPNPGLLGSMPTDRMQTARPTNPPGVDPQGYHLGPTNIAAKLATGFTPPSTKPPGGYAKAPMTAAQAWGNLAKMAARATAKNSPAGATIHDPATISAPGWTGQVAGDVAPNFQGLLNQLQKEGTVVDPANTWAGGSRAPAASFHNAGLATDVNQKVNPETKVTSRTGTNIPVSQENKDALSWGLKPGSMFRNRGKLGTTDAGHFQASNLDAAHLAAAMHQGRGAGVTSAMQGLTFGPADSAPAGLTSGVNDPGVMGAARAQAAVMGASPAQIGIKGGTFADAQMRLADANLTRAITGPLGDKFAAGYGGVSVSPARAIGGEVAGVDATGPAKTTPGPKTTAAGFTGDPAFNDRTTMQQAADVTASMVQRAAQLAHPTGARPSTPNSPLGSAYNSVTQHNVNDPNSPYNAMSPETKSAVAKGILGGLTPSAGAFGVAAAPQAKEATHYFNRDASNPSWGTTDAFTSVGPHVFGTPTAEQARFNQGALAQQLGLSGVVTGDSAAPAAARPANPAMAGVLRDAQAMPGMGTAQTISGANINNLTGPAQTAAPPGTAQTLAGLLNQKSPGPHPSLGQAPSFAPTSPHTLGGWQTAPESDITNPHVIGQPFPRGDIFGPSTPTPTPSAPFPRGDIFGPATTPSAPAAPATTTPTAPAPEAKVPTQNIDVATVAEKLAEWGPEYSAARYQTAKLFGQIPDTVKSITKGKTGGWHVQMKDGTTWDTNPTTGAVSITGGPRKSTSFGAPGFAMGNLDANKVAASLTSQPGFGMFGPEAPSRPTPSAPVPAPSAPAPAPAPPAHPTPAPAPAPPSSILGVGPQNNFNFGFGDLGGWKPGPMAPPSSTQAPTPTPAPPAPPGNSAPMPGMGMPPGGQAPPAPQGPSVAGPPSQPSLGPPQGVPMASAASPNGMGANTGGMTPQPPPSVASSMGAQAPAVGSSSGPGPIDPAIARSILTGMGLNVSGLSDAALQIVFQQVISGQVKLPGTTPTTSPSPTGIPA